MVGRSAATAGVTDLWPGLKSAGVGDDAVGMGDASHPSFVSAGMLLGSVFGLLAGAGVGYLVGAGSLDVAVISALAGLWLGSVAGVAITLPRAVAARRDARELRLARRRRSASVPTEVAAEAEAAGPALATQPLAG